VNYYDVASMATGNQTLNGTSGDDVLIGAAGIDTVTSNTGTDVILTHGGDDAITIDGTGNKTIDGGSGTDSLTISVNGVTSLADYTISTSGDYTVLTDSSSNAIQYKNIETITVGNYAYTQVTGQYHNQYFWSSNEHKIYMYDNGTEVSGDFPYANNDPTGFSKTSTLSVVGSGGYDIFKMENADRTDYTGNLTLSMGGGNDLLLKARLTNSDSIDMGAGDDSVDLDIGAGGTSAFGSVSYTKLDGGSGSDTLDFTRADGTNGQTLTLTFGNATNFENIIGSSNAETIQGDGNNNILVGDGDNSTISSSPVGSDTLHGYGGDDILVAGSNGSTDSWNMARIMEGGLSNYISSINSSDNTGNDNLYGGSGTDTLIGSVGDNTLDGGTGADTIYTGNGSDTIVLRVGDGGSTLADADTVTDFADGSDVLGMDNDMQYTDLTIAQGAGSNSNDTIIKAGTEYLAILTGIDVGLISEADLTPVDII
jgi:Ca2+-binding RTX toxin-like protein